MNALLASNPTEPLPPEYPDDKAFFTVTFYYNEIARRAVMPTRSQQRGLAILVSLLVLYVLWRLAA